MNVVLPLLMVSPATISCTVVILPLYKSTVMLLFESYVLNLKSALPAVVKDLSNLTSKSSVMITCSSEVEPVSDVNFNSPSTLVNEAYLVSA